MKNIIFVVSLLLIGLVIKSSCLHIKQQPAIGNSDVFIQDSYNYFVTRGGNMVWAGALSLAWHELTDSILKEDVKLKSDDKLVQKIVDNYNTCPFKRGDLQESSYYIKSGYGQKTVTQINTQVKQKFPNKSFPDISAILSDKDIISYAYLAKTFQYPYKFTTNDNFQFKESPVKSFKATSEQHRDQVNYLYYQNGNEFLVKLKTKKQNEGVYLLRTDYADASVKNIVGQVNKWEKQPLQWMDKVDRFEMPVVDLDYAREVAQVENIPLLNEKFTNYVFSTVYQGVKLKIDQAGVKVENEGVIIAKVTSALIDNPPKPKNFVFDDTFWIVLKQQGKHPYLVIKVNNPKEKQQL